MEQKQGDILHEILDGSQEECLGLKVYNFTKATKKDVTRERLFVSGENRGFFSPCRAPRVVALEAEDVNCLVESLNNYSGYLHGAIERCPDMGSAHSYSVRLSFVEGLIMKLTH